MNDIDPIHYAWECCNRGVSLPSALRMKNTGVSPLASSLSSAGRIPTAASVSPEEAAARAATHSRLLRGRRLKRLKSATENGGRALPLAEVTQGL